MTTLSEYHAEQMKDPEYAAEYERLRPEYDIIDAIIAARAEENLTQRELAQRCGMKQSAFARLESGNANPTLETLKRVAEGLGKQLRISFVYRVRFRQLGNFSRAARKIVYANTCCARTARRMRA